MEACDIVIALTDCIVGQCRLGGSSLPMDEMSLITCCLCLQAMHALSLGRLGKLWMFNSPGIFYALWKVVSPFVDSVTKSKIEFIDGDKAVEAFRAAIGLDVCPFVLCIIIRM